MDLNNVTFGELQEMLSKLGNQSSETQPQSKSPGLTLEKVRDEWIKHYKTDTDAKELSKSSLRNYESHVRNFSDWTDCVGVEEVTKSTIIEYREYLHITKGLKPTSVNTVLIAINQFFSYCVEKGHCEKNPVKNVGKVKHDALQPKSLDDSTVNTLRNFIELNCEKRNDNTHLMIFDFMLNVGLRVGEVLNLKFENINENVLLDGEVKTVVSVRGGKGNKDRDIVMPKCLRESYTQYRTNLYRSKNVSQHIFQHHGNEYKDTAVRTFYFRLCKEHGIVHVSPHNLRHTYAVRKINDKVPPTILQNDLGHKSFSTTARYAMPSLEDKAKYAG